MHRNATQTSRARRQRHTDAERTLWQMLRARKLAGYTFRRQGPVGPDIVDFYCAPQRLIIKADVARAADRPRGASLTAQGFDVLWLCNTDILTQPCAVAARILATLEQRHV